MSLRTIASAGLVSLSAIAFAASAQAASTIDMNKDGSISMDQAHAAAQKKFEHLDKMHTGHVTAKQIPPAQKAIREMARHDKDHSINKDEYMAGVDAAFKEADPAGSGTLNAAALKTKAGRHFLSLVE